LAARGRLKNDRMDCPYLPRSTRGTFQGGDLPSCSQEGTQERKKPGTNGKPAKPRGGLGGKKVKRPKGEEMGKTPQGGLPDSKKIERRLLRRGKRDRNKGHKGTRGMKWGRGGRNRPGRVYYCKKTVQDEGGNPLWSVRPTRLKTCNRPGNCQQGETPTGEAWRHEGY